VRPVRYAEGGGRGVKVVVGLSGGIDSAVAALLLREQGHDVVGVFLRLWDPLAGRASRCCSPEDEADAARVAAALGIGFEVACASREFFDRVFLAALEAYAGGLTPNPCVVCNQRVKFAELEAVAARLGADAVATGHYARVARDPGGRVRLLRGADRAKDQSYHLHRLTAARLGRVLLPLGELGKDRVRKIGAAAGLSVAGKPDSQELCFVPPGSSYAELVEGWLPGSARPGPILDLEGRELGRHGGIHRFTVGQRRGVGVAAGRPLYVVALDPARAAVIVGPREALEVRRFRVDDPSWIAGAPPAARFRCEVQVRARHRPVPCTVSVGGAALVVCTEEPVAAPAPGQAAVLYRGDEVLGGGWIARP